MHDNHTVRSPNTADLIPGRRARGRPPLDPVHRTHKILEAAIKLFTSRGYSGTSVAEISEIAGVTKRTVYLLVGDKAAVFSAVCAELCERGSTFDFDTAVRDIPARKVLYTVAEQILHYALDEETIAFNRTLAMESLRFPELAVTAMKRGRTILNDALAIVLEDLIERGEVVAGHPITMAENFYDLIVGNQPLRAVMGYRESFPAEDVIYSRIDLFLNGMAVRRSEQLLPSSRRENST